VSEDNKKHELPDLEIYKKVTIDDILESRNKRKPFYKNIRIVLGIVFFTLGLLLFWFDQQRTFKLKPMKSAWDNVDESDIADLDMLLYFKEESNIKPIERPDIIGDYEILSSTIIPENLGLRREERDSNYLLVSDLGAELMENKTIIFDGVFFKMDGKKQGYRTLTERDIEVASSEGHSSLNRYIAKDGYFRMFANPQMFYMDLKMKDAKNIDNVFDKYKSEQMISVEDAMTVTEFFVFAIKDENPVMLILTMGEDLEKAFLEYLPEAIDSYINYDYAIEAAAKVIHQKLIDKYGKEWQSLIEINVDYDAQRVELLIDDDPFGQFYIRFSEIVNDFEFTIE